METNSSFLTNEELENVSGGTEVRQSSKLLLATALIENNISLALEYADCILQETGGKQLVDITLSQFLNAYPENDASRAVQEML